jgi:hypothetical protein
VLLKHDSPVLYFRLRAGRVGTAYSLLTREELPYLLDLHLFVARPLKPAEVQPLAGAAAAAESMEPGTSIYGTFPQVCWNMDADSVCALSGVCMHAEDVLCEWLCASF